MAEVRKLPLRGAMNHKVGIWIDHKKAVIVSASADHVTAKTLESEIGPHARYSGGAGYPTPDEASSRPSPRMRLRSQVPSHTVATDNPVMTSTRGRLGERGASRSAYPSLKTKVGSQPLARANFASAGPNSSCLPSM